MGRQIILKSNGTFAIWSSVVDDFVVDDASEGEVVAEYVGAAAHDAAVNTLRLIRQIQSGEFPRSNFSLTYEEACNCRDNVHG